MLLVRSLYYSDAALSSVGDIDAILDTARRRNAELNITGVLIIDRGRFLQVLEGGREAVSSLMLRIAADPRHCNMRIADFAEVSERRHHTWSMGYVDAETCLSPVRLTQFDSAPADSLYRQVEYYLAQPQYAA
ncbi:BLUF domain-containing protein [Maricaulaceae bacterium MS644]